MKRGSSLFAILLMAQACRWGLVYAADVDGNGLDDEFEQQVAERFCPAFVINANSIVEPEPVEIMSTEHGMGGAGVLGPEDAFCAIFDSALDYQGSDFYCERLYVDTRPSCYSSNIASWEYNEEPRYYSPMVEYWHSHFEYGLPGDEDATAWRNKYVYGGEGVEAPGSAYPPTVYAHFVSSPKIQTVEK